MEAEYDKKLKEGNASGGNIVVRWQNGATKAADEKKTEAEESEANKEGALAGARRIAVFYNFAKESNDVRMGVGDELRLKLDNYDGPGADTEEDFWECSGQVRFAR